MHGKHCLATACISNTAACNFYLNGSVCVCVLQNKLNINDWSSVQSLFDKLNKQMEKAQKATETLGAPRVYIKMLVELEVSPIQIPPSEIPRHAHLLGKPPTAVLTLTALSPKCMLDDLQACDQS